MIIDDGLAREARQRHTKFLVISGALALAVLVLAHSVLLPFVLALVIAYLLTPLVAWVESRRVSRAVAIILVYVVVLGTLGVFVRLTAPRVGQELASLRREVPALSYTVKTRWVPEVQQRLRNAGFGPEARTPDHAAAEEADGREPACGHDRRAPARPTARSASS